MRLRKGDKVRVYGHGQNSVEFHTGCAGVISHFGEYDGCISGLKKYKVSPIVCVKSKDGTFDWFHHLQLKKIAEKKCT